MFLYQKLENTVITKCKFSASDIFTGATCEELCPSTHSIDVPIVIKKDWMIQGIQDETYVLLMDDDGEMREDLQVPSVMYKTDDDLKTTNMIKEYCEMVNNQQANIDIFCCVISAVGQRKNSRSKKKRCLKVIIQYLIQYCLHLYIVNY